MNFSRLMWNILSHPDDSLYRTEVRISVENESLLFEHNLFLQLTNLQKGTKIFYFETFFM